MKLSASSIDYVEISYVHPSADSVTSNLVNQQIGKHVKFKRHIMIESALNLVKTEISVMRKYKGLTQSQPLLFFKFFFFYF